MVHFRECVDDRNLSLARQAKLLERARMPEADPKPKRRDLPINLLLMFLLGFLGVKAYTAVSLDPLTSISSLSVLESGVTAEGVDR